MATIYSRFSITDKDANIIKLRIQGIEGTKKNQIVDFMIENDFFNEESFFKAAGGTRTEEDQDMMRNEFDFFQDKEKGTCLVCCLDKDGDSDIEIVATNPLYFDLASDEDDFENDSGSPIWEKFFRIIKSLPDPKELMNVQSYMGGAGLSVAHKYRGYGIATEMLKARKPLLETLGFEATGAWFTSLGSMRAAEKAGYKTVAQITSEELGRRCGLQFIDAPDILKFMVMMRD